MEDQLVSYEVSKLAKKKGFKARTALYSRLVTSNAYFYNNGQFGPTPNLRDEFYPAPTQSLLQRWMREVHNLDCSPCCTNNRGEWGAYVTHIVLSEEANVHWEQFEELYPTYEEALERGLLFALNLLPDK